MNKQFAIFDRASKMWVAGFREDFACVIVTSDATRVKRFDTEKQASDWAANHWDAGFGLSAANTEVRAAPPPTGAV